MKTYRKQLEGYFDSLIKTYGEVGINYTTIPNDVGVVDDEIFCKEFLEALTAPTVVDNEIF